MWKRIVLLLLVMAALIALVAYSQRRPELAKISGFIEADEIRLGSRVGGRVAPRARRGRPGGPPGDVLVELEPFDLLELEQEAEAQVAAKQAEYDRLQAGFRAEEKAPSQGPRRPVAGASWNCWSTGPARRRRRRAEAQLSGRRIDAQAGPAKPRAGQRPVPERSGAARAVR